MVNFLKDRWLYNFIIGFFLIDLVLGGAGTYLALGPLSIRKLLFIVIILLSLYQIFILRKTQNFKSTKNIIILGVLLVVFSIIAGIGVLNNPFGLVINKFLSYSYIFLMPFLLMNITSKEEALKWYNFFCKLVIILASISSIIFIILLFHNAKIFHMLNTTLNDLNIGSLAINGSLPRVFFKTSIFMPFVLNYEIIKVIKDHKLFNKIQVFKILVLAFGVFSSMTMGIWGAFGVIFFISLCFMYKELLIIFKPRKNQILLALGIIVFFIIAINLGIFDILKQRLNSDDFSVQVKAAQTNELLTLFSNKPIFGYGFGKVATVSIPGFERTAANWEIMWLELLMNGGIIGLVTYLSIIVYNIWLGFTLCKNNIINNSPLFINIITSIIGLIVVNFSNPFLNNPIGIGYFILTVAVINSFFADLKKEKYEGGNI